MSERVETVRNVLERIGCLDVLLEYEWSRPDELEALLDAIPIRGVCPDGGHPPVVAVVTKEAVEACVEPAVMAIGVYIANTNSNQRSLRGEVRAAIPAILSALNIEVAEEVGEFGTDACEDAWVELEDGKQVVLCPKFRGSRFSDQPASPGDRIAILRRNDDA